MTDAITKTKDARHDHAPHADRQEDVPYGSNGVRLTGREWLIAGIIAAAVLGPLPSLWERVEPFHAGEDYRIPYGSSNDYWMYDRYSRQASSEGKCLVLGDSVVWGHYVDKARTLSHYLNALAAAERFANMGVDGIHPAAMAGLVEHYGRAISGRNVILHCNPLWMSSTTHDLQDRKALSFNHPKLVPQFFPKIPCYSEPIAGKLAIVVGRNLPLYRWADHLRLAYFQNADIPTWTLDHPRDNPIAAVLRKRLHPEPVDPPKPPAESWIKAQIPKFDAPWVELETSFQWRCFQRTIEILTERGNKVFVLVGPFNEHMLTEQSLAAYRQRKAAMEAWLAEKKIPHYVPAALPSEYYADGSHPLGEGYEMLARRLFENEEFVRFDVAARTSAPRGENPK